MATQWATHKLEHDLRKRGHTIIVGMDEVGRGSLAGPLVVGCVGIASDLSFPVCDSKLIRKRSDREMKAKLIQTEVVGWGIGEAAASEIDEFGLSNALRLAYQRALSGLQPPPTCIITDGNVNYLANFNGDVIVEVAADRKHSCVAAASIIAKVYRDKLMEKLATTYRDYGFEQNVGYGTVAHKAAIAQFGLSPIHRRSFCK